MSKQEGLSQLDPEVKNSDNSILEVDAGAFIDFCAVAEQIAATTKRLQKAALLGGYFTGLTDDDLTVAARYFAGYIFPLRSQQTMNIGGAALLNAISAVTKQEKTSLQQQLVKLGDPGEVAFLSFSQNSLVQQPTLTLKDLSQKLDELAMTSGTKRKAQLVTSLLKLATPLEAKYIVKLLAGDLRIGLKEGAVEDALARLFNIDVSKVQWVNMLAGDIGETALLARHQHLDRAKMRLFHPIKFMLASPVADLTEVAVQFPTGFVVEDKYDGIRAQVHVAPIAESTDPILHGTAYDGRRVAIFSRTLDEITTSFPDLVEPLANIISTTGDRARTQENGLILDGEIVPIMGDKILPFQQLQQRLGRKKVSPDLIGAIPVAFIAYDVLYAQDRVLINEPLKERRTVLESLQLNYAQVRCCSSQPMADISGLDAEFIAARARGNEGLMVKDPGSSYKPGRRGREWLKIKRALATLDVVVTAAEVGSGKRHRFLSDYTFAVRKSETDSTLLNVGKAYSGLTDEEVTQLSNWFREHTLEQLAHGKVCIVEPRIVLEVTFDRVQASDRHNSGFALRFPRILRIRDDKPPEEIDTLETVRTLAQTSQDLPNDPAAQDRLVDASVATPNLEVARNVFQTFVASIKLEQPVTILHDSDADGVTAGVVLQLALTKAGYSKVTRVIPDRERNAWTSANRESVQATAPQRLFVLDLGSQSEPIIPGVSTCFIDHHRPEGVPEGDTLISAYTWNPIPNTSLIIWELCKSLADISDIDWIAAIGTMSDLGEKAPFEMLAIAKSKYTAKYLKEATALINASRRAANYQPEVAAKALLTHKSPKELVNSHSQEVAQLRTAREQVKVALEQARKAAPVFAGNVALVRINSPCQIHPLIAQSWRTRLPKYIVIAANEGYIPGRVNFSVRTDSGINVLDFLRSFDISASEGNYGHGHDSASGGSLPFEKWHELLSKLGFNI